MIPGDIVLTESDRKAIEKLADFLPDKLFDTHIHPFDATYTPDLAEPGSIFETCGPVVTVDTYMEQQGRLLGNYKKVRANLIICPERSMMVPGSKNRQGIVDFLVGELEKHPGCVGEVPVFACDTKEEIEAMLVHPRIVGFKCYHWTVQKDNTWQCYLDEYLPQAAWEVANERGLCITLHMVRDLALADPDNLAQICANAAKYPNAKLILAHAARGFASWTVMDTVEQVAKYPNIYFDFSAVCEPLPFMAIIKAVGHKRVMWGSDYPVTMMRGKCVSVGSEFLWLYKEQLSNCASKTNFNAHLIGVENLMAMRTACKMLELTREQVEDIFYNNAMELFGLTD